MRSRALLLFSLGSLILIAGCGDAASEPASVNGPTPAVSDSESFLEVDLGDVCEVVARRPLGGMEAPLDFDVAATQTIEGAGGSCGVTASLAESTTNNGATAYFDPYYSAEIRMTYRPADAGEEPYSEFSLRFGDDAISIDDYGLFVDLDPSDERDRHSLGVSSVGAAVIEVEIRHQRPLGVEGDDNDLVLPSVDVHIEIFQYVVDSFLAARGDNDRRPSSSARSEEPVFYGESQAVCLDQAALNGPPPTADSIGFVADPDGNALCVGPSLLSATALETVEVDGGAVQLVFLAGAEGIDAFNSAAAQCFARTDVCPSQRLALVLNGRALSAPVIQVAQFDRDQVVVSGSFTNDQAELLADQISASILSSTNEFLFRPVLLDMGAGTVELELE